jgi:hypothetical protein
MCIVASYCIIYFLAYSTYSTLYNHPTRILEPRVTDDGFDGRSCGEIMLSRKTGIPLGVVHGPLPKENHPSRGESTVKQTTSYFTTQTSCVLNLLRSGLNMLVFITLVLVYPHLQPFSRKIAKKQQILLQ